ncbi:hypothetical protein L1987_30496 [Smallanthus sonchifolius]|uniref:Uncharacterized protein n=1 Tax=Smallanthus sonchifolius TaxID=185202 RepID=A0ACB9I2X0_9ASTR|nr:hypothetical protein L1987_30496 [Smallanthus sonchifolius]
MFPPPPTEAILFRISASVGFTVDRQSGHVLLDLSHASIHCVIYGSHSTRLYEKEDECARFENYKMVVQLDPKSIETNPETQMSPRPIALWYNLHFRAKKGWLNDHSRIQYFTSEFKTPMFTSEPILTRYITSEIRILQ